MPESPLLVVRRLTVRYPQPRLFPWRRRYWRNVVDGIDFNLHAGETLGIVGESGCGKSSLARALLGVQPIASGAAIFKGTDLAQLDRKQWKPLRREIQMVFQDPLASLDPRMRVGKIIEQPLAALRPDIDKADSLDLDAIERDLNDVQIALERLNDGNYWTDEITGEPIADDVPAAHPPARTATPTLG